MQDEVAQTVLVVEDDEDSRDLMTEVLESSGYRVVATAGGAEALRVILERRLDAVVTDVGLPGVGGLDVARAAKARAGIPVIVVTGYSERDDIAEAQGRDVDRVLVKPVDPDALADAVRAVLAGR